MVMDVMAAAARIEAAGGHVIHMEVGQPAASAPKTAISAAHAALDGGRVDYTSALGMPSLRDRIARHYRETYGCAVDAERIVVTTGSSGAFILAFLALFEPGDRVADAPDGGLGAAPAGGQGRFGAHAHASVMSSPSCSSSAAAARSAARKAVLQTRWK